MEFIIKREVKSLSKADIIGVPYSPTHNKETFFYHLVRFKREKQTINNNGERK